VRTYKSEVIGPGRWEPIVERDSWDQAMRVLTDAARRSTVSRRSRHRLSGSQRMGCVVHGCGPVSPSTSAAIDGRCTGCPAGHVARSQVHVDELVTAVVLGRLAMPDAAVVFAPRVPSVGRGYEAEARVLGQKLAGAAEDYADDLLTRAQLRPAPSVCGPRSNSSKPCLRVLHPRARW